METRALTPKGQRGYIALISVLITSALILLIGVGGSMRGVDAAALAMGEGAALRAELLADSCVEEALVRLRANFGYAGNETIMVGSGGTCDILSVTGSGNADRTILVRASDNGYVRTLRVEVAKLLPTPVILSRAIVR